MQLFSTVDQGNKEWAYWVKMGDTVYYCQSSFEEKDIPKQAGFSWHRNGKKVWWTNDKNKAAKLADYAVSLELREDLMQLKHQQNVSFESSKAATADIEIPHNEGMDYFPFQRAGILYCLQKFRC